MKWSDIAYKMRQEFQWSGNPVFCCSYPLESGQLKCYCAKEHIIHFNADPSCPELLMWTIMARRCINANLTLILTSLSMILRHQYSMPPTTWLAQRANMMWPIVFLSFSVREVSREAGFLLTVSVGKTLWRNRPCYLKLGYLDDPPCTRDAEWCKPIVVYDEKTAIFPAVDVQVTPEYVR